MLAYDEWGNPIIPDHQDYKSDPHSTHRINPNILPHNEENLVIYSSRLRRATMVSNEVQSQHYDGTIKKFWCHENRGGCWVCDINTQLLQATRIMENNLNIPEFKALAEKTYWIQQPDGKYAWQYNG